MLGSTGAGLFSSRLGIGGSWLGSTRLGEWATVRLSLVTVSEEGDGRFRIQSNSRLDITRRRLAGDELVPALGTLTHNVHGVP